MLNLKRIGKSAMIKWEAAAIPGAGAGNQLGCSGWDETREKVTRDGGARAGGQSLLLLLLTEWQDTRGLDGQCV